MFVEDYTIANSKFLMLVPNEGTLSYVNQPSQDFRFRSDETCIACGMRISVHVALSFDSHPNDLRAGTSDVEWRHDPDMATFTQPSGVTIVNIFDEIEEVEGDTYTPCATMKGESTLWWFCIEYFADTPCTDDFMKEISS